MKLSVLLLVVASAAVPASAQVVRFSAPVNPVMGLPKLLPSPLSGPLAPTVISLPAPAALPALIAPAPSLAAPVVAILPAPSAPAAPSASREDSLPRVNVVAGRENRANPFRGILPDGVARFDGSAPAKAGDDSADEQDLNKIFDGEDAPAERPTVELPRRAPVTPSRRHSLPEWDLENELGLSSH